MTDETKDRGKDSAAADRTRTEESRQDASGAPGEHRDERAPGENGQPRERFGANELDQSTRERDGEERGEIF
jgi:hypothetical protein